jgi:hypothetical protein
MRKLIAQIGLCVLVCSSAWAQPNADAHAEAAAAAHWETLVRAFPDPARCVELSESFFALVNPRHRPAAIAQLADTQAVAISRVEAKQLTSSALSDTSGVQPFLVRAVAKNEVPAFSVRLCDDVLYVVHGSLGRGPPPPSRRVPLVVLLDHRPSRVVVTWAIAE